MSEAFLIGLLIGAFISLGVSALIFAVKRKGADLEELIMKRRVKKAKVHRGEDRKWYATLCGRNGEPLAHTEGHERKASLLRTLRRNFEDFVIVFIEEKC